MQTGDAWTAFIAAWLIVDAANKEEARLVVPPLFRSQAKIVGLNKFNLEQIDGMIAKLES
jgi:hypothetical protein